jgi:hypothetical protein
MNDVAQYPQADSQPSASLKQCARIKDQLFQLRDKLRPVLPDNEGMGLKEAAKPMHPAPLLRELDDISEFIGTLISELSV